MAALGFAACGESSTTTVRQSSATAVGGSSPTTSILSATTSLMAPTTSQTSELVPVEWQRVEFVGVSAYLLIRNGEIALIDTGNPGSAFTIEQVINASGLSWANVGHVVVTHSHGDHAGSLRAILGFAEEATAYAGAGDLAQMNSPRPIQPVGDGDSVFGLAVIETPGHTPGHISVLDPLGLLLLAGDALVGNNGRVVGPDASFSDNISVANDSVRKLAGFEYETILFGHGGPVLSTGSEQVQSLADNPS